MSHFIKLEHFAISNSLFLLFITTLLCLSLYFINIFNSFNAALYLYLVYPLIYKNDSSNSKFNIYPRAFIYYALPKPSIFFNNISYFSFNYYYDNYPYIYGKFIPNPSYLLFTNSFLLYASYFTNLAKFWSHFYFFLFYTTCLINFTNPYINPKLFSYPNIP